MRKSFALVILLLARCNATEVYDATTFSPEAVCADVAPCPLTNASCVEHMLDGKHLYVLGVDYPPFGVHDATQEGRAAWSGFDFDVLDRLAARLGFTYTVLRFTVDAGETWSDALARQANAADLVLSWWAHSAARRNTLYLLNGHIDTSLYLATVPPDSDKKDFHEQLLTFMAPFHWTAWVGIVVTVLIGVCMTYLLERPEAAPGCSDARTRLGRRRLRDHHLSRDGLVGVAYTSFKALLWGEHPDPHTDLGALANLGFGFFCLVLIASYTANLAAFMTTQAEAVLSVHSVDDLTINSWGACMKASTYDLVSDGLRSRYPRLAIELLDSHARAADTMKEQRTSCKAAIMADSTIEEMVATQEYCWLNKVGSVLYRSEGGFVSNLRASCVVQAVELGLSELQESGVLEALHAAWLPRYSACDGVDATGAVETSWYSPSGAELDIIEMGGVLVIYLGIMALLLAIRCYLDVSAGARRLSSRLSIRRSSKSRPGSRRTLADGERSVTFGESTVPPLGGGGGSSKLRGAASAKWMAAAALPAEQSAGRDFFRTTREPSTGGGRKFFKGSARGVEASDLEELRDDLSRELAEKIEASNHQMQEHLTGVILNALGKPVPPKGERRRRSKAPGPSCNLTSSSASSFDANTPRSFPRTATGQPVDNVAHKCGLFLTGTVPTDGDGE